MELSDAVSQYIYSCCLFLHVAFVNFSLECSCGYHHFSAMNLEVLEFIYSMSLDTHHCHARASSAHAGTMVTDQSHLRPISTPGENASLC